MKQQEKKTEATLINVLGLLRLENSTENDIQSKTNEVQKAIELNKKKKFNYALQRIKINDDQKATKTFQKMLTTDKKDKKGSLYELIKDYIIQNMEMTMALFVSYLIFIGLIVGTPFIVKHLKVTSSFQIDKERFKLIFKKFSNSY